MVHLPVTEKHSKVFENTYKIGLEAEALVIQYFEDQGYILQHQRLRTPFAEIDLVFTLDLSGERSNKWLVVEVKKNSSIEFRQYVLSRRQKTRLQRVMQWFSELGREVEFCLAIVNKDGSIEEYWDIFV